MKHNVFLQELRLRQSKALEQLSEKINEFARSMYEEEQIHGMIKRTLSNRADNGFGYAEFDLTVSFLVGKKETSFTVKDIESFNEKLGAELYYVNENYMEVDREVCSKVIVSFSAE